QLTVVETHTDDAIGPFVLEPLDVAYQRYLPGASQGESVRTAMGERVISSGRIPLYEVACCVIPEAGAERRRKLEADSPAKWCPIGVSPEDPYSSGAAVRIIRGSLGVPISGVRERIAPHRRRNLSQPEIQRYIGAPYADGIVSTGLCVIRNPINDVGGQGSSGEIKCEREREPVVAVSVARPPGRSARTCRVSRRPPWDRERSRSCCDHGTRRGIRSAVIHIVQFQRDWMAPGRPGVKRGPVRGQCPVAHHQRHLGHRVTGPPKLDQVAELCRLIGLIPQAWHIGWKRPGNAAITERA